MHQTAHTVAIEFDGVTAIYSNGWKKSLQNRSVKKRRNITFACSVREALPSQIYRKIATENDCVELQKIWIFYKNGQTCCKWLLSFKAKKCKVMRLGGQHPEFIYKMTNNSNVTDLAFTEM